MIQTFTEFATNAIFKLGDQELLSSYKTVKKMEYYTFICATNQPIQVVIDSIPFTIAPDEIVSLTPVQYFEFVAGKNAVVYQFNREFYCIQDHDKEVSCLGILFYGNTTIPHIKLSSKDAQNYRTLHEIIKEELSTEDSIQAEMLRILLKRFIIKTTRLIKIQDIGDSKAIHDEKLQVLRSFNFLVESHFRKEHSVSFYADQLHKSAKTLSNSFSAYGKGPLHIIHDRLILETKRLLSYTDKSAKEIAYEIGFEDASHLSRLFKKNTGVSPSEFRKKIHAVTSSEVV